MSVLHSLSLSQVFPADLVIDQFLALSTYRLINIVCLYSIVCYLFKIWHFCFFQIWLKLVVKPFSMSTCHVTLVLCWQEQPWQCCECQLLVRGGAMCLPVSSGAVWRCMLTRESEKRHCWYWCQWVFHLISDTKLVSESLFSPDIPKKSLYVTDNLLEHQSPLI